MENRKTLLRLISLCLVIALALTVPLAAAGLIYCLTGNAYEKTYYAALPLKLDRLAAASGPRVIVIGGSSAAFGIDSKLVERELGRPCVNFGLYAAFGLKPMLDLSARHLREGDIVILAPETTAQMYSAYCGYDYLLQAFETRPGTLLRLGADYTLGLVSRLPGYLSAKGKLQGEGGAPTAGVYALASFDEYGDIVYPRPDNIMAQGYSGDNLPELSAALVTPEFLSLVNEYTARARQKGAEVYFSFCPINALSAAGIAQADMDDLVSALQAGLDCEILSPLSDHILDAGFFYDSNYHLNDVGVQYNSLLLAGDVERVLGRVTSHAALPRAPRLERSVSVLASGAEGGLKYDITASGAVITGLDEAGLALKAIVVPDTIAGESVVSVAAGAFAGASAETISLPAAVAQLSGSLFSGASSLKRVELYAAELPEVSEELMKGANPDVKLYVPASLCGLYLTDYFWGAYSAYLQPME